jgi:multiple sugar transport system substrate-binding protein
MAPEHHGSGRQGQLTRRDFLRSATGTAAGLALGAWALDPLSAKFAFAGTQERELHLLQWVSFVKEMDDEFIKQAEAWGKENRVQVKIERVGGSDLQPRTAAAVQAKAGPDIIQMQYNWPWLYADNLVDVNDVAEEVKKKVGDKFYKSLDVQCKVGDRGYLSVPYAYVPNAFAYRTDWFQKADAKMPNTWDEFIAEGKKLKKFGKPFGQAMGHSFGDPNTFWYSWLWSHGGKEVLEDGKTVAINSPETIQAAERAQILFDEVWVKGVMSWDDASNNRAYLAQQISCTQNGASIYFVAMRDFPKVAAVTDHFRIPSGPAGRFNWFLTLNHAVMKYSKNADVAKDFIRYIMEPDRYSTWLQSGKGYDMGPGPLAEKDPTWEKDPKVLMFREGVAQEDDRWPGWPGPPSAASSEALVRYIVVDIFAKTCSGEFTAAEAAKWAEDQLKRIYKS